VRVLIFHGYLLHGTGSNVYNANLARTLKELGHEVHLICQDQAARELPWVQDGSVTVHLPDIGGLLPVFVADRYEGFEVKTFPELSDAELKRYLDANVAAVREVVDRHGDPDAALANHLIMGPAILARAGLRFAIKVHGSDLSYTVRADPDRFVPYAREGTDAASAVLVGSAHTAEDLLARVSDPSLADRTRLGPPGVDVNRFRPRPRAEALGPLGDLMARLDSESSGSDDAFGRDGPAIATALRRWAVFGSVRALFVGKLLVNKGVDLLAAAWPLVHREQRAAGSENPRLLFVGFGAYRPGLGALVEALDRGDLDAARSVAARGRGYEGGEESRLPILSAFLEAPPAGYEQAARDAAGSIMIGGRLAHDEVAAVMPLADVFAMPSTFPESFGMVPAESAACGVPPVSADHSGMREVSRQLGDAVGAELAPLLSFAVGPDAVTELAERLNGWLALDPAARARAGEAMAARVSELWSWERVARDVLAASAGELDELPKVGG
jgi:glycosyltransferase involved in cell wall biosynthesis